MNENQTFLNVPSSFSSDLDPVFLSPSTHVGAGPVRYSAWEDRNQGGTSAAPMQAPAGPSTRVGRGAVRIHADGSEESIGVTRVVMNRDGVTGGSVAQTLDRQGTEYTVELLPGQPSSRTDVRTAERMGLIQRGAGGVWVDAAGAKVNTVTLTPEQAAQHHEALQADQRADELKAMHDAGFEHAAVMQWEAAIAPIPQGPYDMAAARITGVVTSGDLSRLDNAIRELNQQTEMGEEKARAVVMQGVKLYQDTAARALAEMGVTDLDAFGRWARSVEPHRLQRGVQELVMLHRTNTLKVLGRAYTNAMR